MSLALRCAAPYWALLVFVTITGYAKALMAEDSNEAYWRTHATVTWDDAGAALGRILLIRKEKGTCAVRFTNARRGHDARPSSMFDSGEESFSAEYDWYLQEDGSGDFTRPGVVSGHERLARNSLKGIGRLAFQTGQIYVKCGAFKLRWMFPTRVAFYSTGVIPGDYGIELAPTKWTEISEVDVHDTRLKWYRYNENRKPVDIPLDDL